MFIKTKTAAMGVRGTDFTSIYNPSLQNTSVVTFEGDVRLAKIDPTEVAEVNNDPIALAENLEKAVTDKQRSFHYSWKVFKLQCQGSETKPSR